MRFFNSLLSSHVLEKRDGLDQSPLSFEASRLAAQTMAGMEFTSKLYQYYQLSASFLYAALLARWLIVLPLAGSRFLPGGIHEFLCYLLVISSVIEIAWLVKFHRVWGTLTHKTLLKDLNFVYFVAVMHFHDDYEHALVLKNASYSSFIIGLSICESYSHWVKLFKRDVTKTKTKYWKIVAYLAMPLLYTSEFYLLLLNVQNPNFHSTPLLDKINKAVLVAFFPIALTLYKKHLFGKTH